MKNRIFAMVICLVLILGLFPVNAMAVEVVDSGKCDGNAKWTIDENNVLTVTADGETEDGTYYLGEIWTTRYREVQKIIVGDGVTSIGEDAFAKFINLTSITLSDSVVEIDINALNGDKLLEIIVDEDNSRFCDENGVLYNKSKTSLICVPRKMEGAFVIPDGVKIIGEKALYCCSNLTDIKIPNSVTDIESYAFAGCSVDELIIPEGVKEIKAGVFSGGEMSKVVFENSSIFYDLYSFIGCDNLTSIELKGSDVNGYEKMMEKALEDESNSDFSSDGNGVLFNGDKSEIIYAAADVEMIVVPDSVTNIRKNAFNYCKDLEIIEFLGDVPSFEEGTFSSITANIFYNGDNETWTEEAIQSIEAEGEWVMEMPKSGTIAKENSTDYGVLIGFGIVILIIFAFSLPGYIKQEREKTAENSKQPEDKGENE